MLRKAEEQVVVVDVVDFVGEDCGDGEGGEGEEGCEEGRWEEAHFGDGCARAMAR